MLNGITEQPFHRSESGVGLTPTISSQWYLGLSGVEDRLNALRNALRPQDPGDHNAVAVNIAISYEFGHMRPVGDEGLRQVDFMLREVLPLEGISAFRLWYDKIYTHKEEVMPHMLSQTWISHGLTPYAKFPVFVVGGPRALNSRRGWVRCELAAATLHKGLCWVEGGRVHVRRGKGTKWNSDEGKGLARKIHDGLADGTYVVRLDRERTTIMELMRQYAGI